MAALMANPELRNPFPEKPIHPDGNTTVLYQGKTFQVTTSPDGKLLVSPEELNRITGFELKPEGACLADLCVPLNNQLLVEQDGQQQIDLAAFAEHMGQAFVVDAESRVWSFAEMPAKRENMMANAMAPDLDITDRQGNVINLADLKGKKALIVTWSSW